MAREVDPRAAEMSFRQVPRYTLSVDKHTAFLAAVDRNTKAPEVKIPSVEGLRGALSYAVARAFEGGADADHDGKVTLKELFANVRQVVYQLSDQRQNIVTKASPSRSVDSDVVFQLTRGPALTVQSSPQGASQGAVLASVPDRAAPGANTSASEEPAVTRSSVPIRLAALDGRTNYFPKLTSRETTIEIVRPIDDPDLIWDPKSHDAISWGDVVA
jgi:hypothetical protein